MGYSHKVAFKAKLAKIKTCIFLTIQINTHIYTFVSASVVKLCCIIDCLKGFTLLYHIPHKDGIHHLASKETGKTTRMHILLQTSLSVILCGQNVGENPPLQTQKSS